MELQSYLRGETGVPVCDAVGRLKTAYGITAKPHPELPNLVQFRYDQIDSPMGLRMCQEARGVILDSADNWNVVARPFDKFFNVEEGHAAKIDWSTARAQEKCLMQADKSMTLACPSPICSGILPGLWEDSDSRPQVVST